MVLEHGEVAVDMMRAVKAALDLITFAESGKSSALGLKSNATVAPLKNGKTIAPLPVNYAARNRRGASEPPTHATINLQIAASQHPR